MAPRQFFAAFLFLVVTLVQSSRAEDIDLFAGIPTDVGDALPSVIFILDNTSNWSRQSQRWPDRSAQGQSEVLAIKTALEPLVDQVNVGLVEFVTAGNANEDGGYVRFDLQPLTATAYGNLSATLTDIFDNINSPTEARNANENWGDLMFDLYNYLAGGAQSDSGGGTPTGLADAAAYRTPFSTFASPLTADDICTNSYVVFIGNPNSSGPRQDEASNSAALTALYESLGRQPPDALSGASAGTPLPLPELTTTFIEGDSDTLGLSADRWKKNQQDQCTAAEQRNNNHAACFENDSCACVEITNACVKGGACFWDVATVGTGTTVVKPSGSFDTQSGRDWNIDDWAKFLRNYGVPATVNVDGETVTQRVSVITYTIDVFNAQQDADTSSLLLNTAEVGGGRYFAARNENQLVDAIEGILSDIVAVSSSFAAVTLPVNAGQRAQSANQVYIGSFRPALDKEPRWFGNLKRYRLGLFNNQVELADVNYRRAVNPLTGAPGQCAVSWWTSETGDYWENLGVNPPPRGECLDAGVMTSMWSDSPDGSFVEKGGVAQQVREAVQRTIYTVAGGARVELTDSYAADLGGDAVFDYLRGDRAGIDETMPAVGLRASAHGGVIHSRPLVINYGNGTIKAFYGANDGLFRAVDSGTGAEDWALLAPAHYNAIARLYNNDPLILYSGFPEDAELGYEAKDYFFDGSPGDFVVYDENDTVSKALIFPSMRRGGRQLYALDVTDPVDPVLKWVHGCADDSTASCSDDSYRDIGQTWSTPVAFTVKDYVDDAGAAIPVVAFGGGYDTCLDTDQAAFPCAGDARGSAIFLLNAETGVQLAKLSVDAPVVAELAPLDRNLDGSADYLYAVDAAGGLYRVALNKPLDSEAEVVDPAEHWTAAVKVGAMSGDNRRFLNRPEVFTVPQTALVGVAVGSGDRERPLKVNYPYRDDVDNRFYLVLDRPEGAPVGGATLPLDLDADLIDASGNNGASVQATNGWYVELPGLGEQVVNAAAVGGSRVFFNSYQPGGSSTGLCSPPIGIATAYAIDTFFPDNTQGEEMVAGGMPIPPVIATVVIEPEGYDPDDEDGPQLQERTVCIGCEGFDVVEIDPVISPARKRMWWIEDMDQ
ncbi:pilus assembly protein [Pseudohaliea rubra]|uniref:Type IV fimbrial biogenesis protein PilY1 n=1 Tax=Pseudohaliea rubra DSM 19751 TaxID=1265313 RepID=A0A095XWT8_9GAMM|nr:PilC/PilY family type IV pilus protein [Pseudohaliea rubra]KGE04136.1 Type IV fimbrial biogenesis protein PilY1 [Pseudohaliea rubra DSM 19751]